jgi:peptidoglycan/LPS O-acetylase OafA/YrhL
MNRIEMKHESRLSNFELLRIVAMLLVMFGHSHLRIAPLTQSSPSILMIVKSMAACVATMGVPIFIAISGWFGIRYKGRGLLKYLFQVFFVLWAIYALSVALGVAEFNTEGLKISMGFYEGYWFIIGYLGLYLISPVLNSFIENTSKRTFQTVLLSLLLFQCYYSWLTAWFDYYNGYSIVLFSVIYLTAAYFRKYPMMWVEKHAPMLLIVIVVVMAVIATFSFWKYGHAARQVRDDNPLVILASILLLLSFKKMRFQSKMVNWLAASCFSVYLIHFNPYVYQHFFSITKKIFDHYIDVTYCVMMLLFLLATYLCCTLFDQLRVLVWRLVTMLFSIYKNPKVC